MGPDFGREIGKALRFVFWAGVGIAFVVGGILTYVITRLTN